MATLKSKRKVIIEAIKLKKQFLTTNAQKLDIHQGNLLPYVDEVLKKSLSAQYYNAIRERILPINILQRYISKVSNAYHKAPTRKAAQDSMKPFLDFYEKHLDINTSGQIADEYSHLFKGFAWEPYISEDGCPAMREIPFDRFLVISESKTNPEHETIFVKIIGSHSGAEDDTLLFAYTDDEFDAFYMNEKEATEYLKDNKGVNPVGTIPFIYGKRQKNRLIPVQDSDILAIAKAIPVMLSDAAGAQMFQCFSILYGIDVSFENASLSPNALWSIKSDKETDKNPQVGTIKPEADTDKVVQFVVNTFVMWLETKGIRVGSVGSVDASNAANGISKIIDEMDVHKVVTTSQDWFSKDESVLWNKKLPKIHNYWIKNNLLDLTKIKDVPGIVQDDPEISIEFQAPEPLISRDVELKNVMDEVDFGSMTFEMGIKKLHPNYSPDVIKELVTAKEAKKVEEDAKFQAELEAKKKAPPGAEQPNQVDKNGVDANKDSNSKAPKTKPA